MTDESSAMLHADLHVRIAIDGVDSLEMRADHFVGINPLRDTTRIEDTSQSHDATGDRILIAVQYGPLDTTRKADIDAAIERLQQALTTP